MNIEQIAASFGRTWLMDPSGFAMLRSARTPQEEPLAATDLGPSCLSLLGPSASAEKPFPFVDGVAVIPLQGVMTKGYSYWYYGCSTPRIRLMIRAAAADPDVKAILLVADTPGGENAGLQELWNEIRIARKSKPVDGFVDDRCFSAGYYALSACRKIFGNATGWTGSLGTLLCIVDSSKAFAQNGLEMLVFSNGVLKGAGTPGTVVTDEQKAQYSAIVATINGYFKSAVTKGRGLAQSKVDSLFTGGQFTSPFALQNGLIDGISSLDKAVSKLLADSVGWSADDEDLGDDPDCQAQSAVVMSLPPEQSPAVLADVHRPIQTISPVPGESTGPRGAGTTTPSAERKEGEPIMLKNALVRALSRIGLGTMAAQIVAIEGESHEDIAAAMSNQVNAEVDRRLADHPLILACQAVGITTPTQLNAVMEAKALGDRYIGEVRAEAQAEAVRIYGPEDGPKISAQVNLMPAQAVITLRDSWRKEADAKFGTGAQGPAQRQTAPSAVAVDVDTKNGGNDKRPWDRLKPEQQAQAQKMGFTNVQQQDAFALNLLGEAN